MISDTGVIHAGQSDGIWSDMTHNDSFAEQSAILVQRINQYLDELLSQSCSSERLRQAMRHAVLAGGKRIRPLLVYAAGRLAGAELRNLDAAAAAVELVHCYSLVHDDLPAMDDDDLRRGRPTLHKAFDEATAILAGDALLALAFQCLADAAADYPDSRAVTASLRVLAHASGGAGMVGGQMLDIAMAGSYPDKALVEQMFSLKTGALIHAAVMMGGYASRQAPDQQLSARLSHFGTAIGLCFQVQDDILDVTGDTARLGKPQGSDEDKDKPNYALRYGLDVARQRADDLFAEAHQSLAEYGSRAEPLRWMAAYITRRDY